MDKSDIREQLQQAVNCIRAGDVQSARRILAPLCQANNADAWWLAAQTTQDPQQIQFALRKALQINPQHERSARQLTMMSAQAQTKAADADPPRRSLLRSLPTDPETAGKPKNVDSDTAPLPRKRKEHDLPPRKTRESDKRSSGSRLPLLLVIITGAFIGLAVMVAVGSMTYTIAPPVLGPYYVRYVTPYAEVAAPCESFLVFGVVKDNAGLTARLRLGGYERQVTIDAAGSFQHVIPWAEVEYRYQRSVHRLGDIPVELRLMDAAGQSQSGVSRLYFGSSCALYVEYWRHDYGGLHFGSPSQRPPEWQGPYRVAYSDITSSPLLICDFTGFTGTAYDDYGPMRDLYIQVSKFDERGSVPQYFVTHTSDLEHQMGPSGWAIFVEPNYRYLIEVLNAEGTIIVSDAFYLYVEPGCDRRLVKVSITQADHRDSAPPALPPDWEYTS